MVFVRHPHHMAGTVFGYVVGDIRIDTHRVAQRNIEWLAFYQTPSKPTNLKAEQLCEAPAISKISLFLSDKTIRKNTLRTGRFPLVGPFEYGKTHLTQRTGNVKIRNKHALRRVVFAMKQWRFP
jgi:hypothetical protein